MSNVTISDFIIALLELLEAQIADIKQAIHKSAWSVGFVMLSVLAMVVGFVFVLWGIKLFLETLIGPVWSVFSVALISLLLAYLFARIAAWNASS